MFVQQLGRVPSGCKRVPLEKHGKTYMYSHVSACSQANAWLTEASHSGSQPQAATGGCGQVHPGAALGFSQPQAGAARCTRATPSACHYLYIHVCRKKQGDCVLGENSPQSDQTEEYFS